MPYCSIYNIYSFHTLGFVLIISEKGKKCKQQTMPAYNVMLDKFCSVTVDKD